jgi:hypothetical protein
MFSFSQTGPVRQKGEGSIAAVFTSLSDETAQVLPGRFADLKKEIWKDGLVQSWREVLAALETAVDEVSTKGGSVSLVCVYDTYLKIKT